MKRTFILALLAIALCFNAVAQPSQKLKVIHMAAVRMAEQLDVKDSDKESFVSLYQSYKRESGEIMKIQPQASSDAEAAIEAKILSDFDKSERLLTLRKSYYPKFRAILSPSQIQRMYEAERTSSVKK